MNTLIPKYKAIAFSTVMFFAVAFVSCRKEITRVEELQADSITFKDSCSYTIDGKLFVCDQFASFGRGNSVANLDTLTRKYNPDSSLYSNSFTLMKAEDQNSSDDGYFNITFIKKYGKNQLTKTWWIGILGPATESELYKKGAHNYAVDYKRSYSQEGIAFTVSNRTETSSEKLVTYINASAYSSTTIPLNCQNNSKFEITEMRLLPDSSRIIEAKFEANIFDKDEKAKRLENGYFRVHLR